MWKWTKSLAFLNILCVQSTVKFYYFNEKLKKYLEKFVSLKNLFKGRNFNAINPNEVKMAVIGLARDLRGIASSCVKKNSYTIFLNWTYVIFLFYN